MQTSEFTPAYYIYTLFISMLLALIELWWLKKGVPESKHFIYAVSLAGISNFLFVLICVLCFNSYFSLFIFPLPVIPALIFFAKLLVFYIIHKNLVSIPNSLLKVNCIAVCLDMALISSLLFIFSFINPSYANIEKAIIEKKDTALKIMLWIDALDTPSKTMLLKTAMSAGNEKAVDYLLDSNSDPKECYLNSGAAGQTINTDMLWKTIAYRLKHNGKLQEICEEDRQMLPSIIANLSIENINYLIANGFNPENHEDIIYNTIQNYQFKISNKLAIIEGEELLQKKLNLLLKHGANINGEGPMKFTPVFAIINRSENLSLVLETMAGMGLNLNTTTPNELYLNNGVIPIGTSPITLSIINNHPEYIDILIKHGVNITSTDAKGLSAYDYAVRKNYNDTILKKLKFDPNGYCKLISAN